MKKKIINLLNLLKTLRGISSLFIGLPICFLIRIISPFFLIRIMHINATRIGELIINPIIYLYQKEKGINLTKQKSLDIFYLEDYVINQFFLKMLKRKINIGPSYILRPIDDAQKLLDKVINSKEKFKPFLRRKFKTHFIEDFPGSKNNIEFTKKEIEKGKIELEEKFGIKKKDKFVCFLIRDQAFLRKMYPNKNFDYHEYRNMNPLNFLKAAEELSKRNYYVFRMGKFQDGKFEIKGNNKIIDYANCKFKSDFLDIFLSANCSFFLTTKSGPDNLLPLFNVPSIEYPLNLGVCRQFSNYLIAPRIFLDQNDNKLSLKDLFERNLIFSQKKIDFENQKILPIDPTPEDIKHTVIEMDDHLINSKPYSDFENELNEKFWKIFSKYYEKDYRTDDEIKLKGKYITLSRFDINFLKRNYKWFLD